MRICAGREVQYVVMAAPANMQASMHQTTPHPMVTGTEEAEVGLLSHIGRLAHAHMQCH